jgi:hypothetical protein
VVEWGGSVFEMGCFTWAHARWVSRIQAVVVSGSACVDGPRDGICARRHHGVSAARLIDSKR